MSRTDLTSPLTPKILAIATALVLWTGLLGSVPVWADLHLDAPDKLLQRAAVDKNELREVINEIDLNLSEMRDQATFDQYFFILNPLQILAEKLDLDSIYPDAVKKLGNRMVQKGVNWLDIFLTPQDHLLYYQRWMDDYQTASSFLYTAGLQIKDEADRSRLRLAADNLEALMLQADTQWPGEKALLLLYRTTLSDLASKVLKTETPSDTETEFWLGKIYTADAMSEFATLLQGQVYNLTPETVGNTHWIVRRLLLVYNHTMKPSFGATESLTGQTGDTAVDLILKTFRLNEKLSDAEFSQLLSVLQTRHFIALASGWASFGKVPRGTFAGYYLQRAFEFIKVLQAKGLGPDALSLSQSLDKKSAAIQARQSDLEGTWIMQDSRGAKWRLVIAFATEETLFASFNDEWQTYVRPLFNVIYDAKMASFVASERPADVDRSPNRAIRIYALGNGKLKIVDLDAPLKAPMIASRVQTYPDLLDQGVKDSPPIIDGTYLGTIVIPGGQATKVSLAITVFGGASIGNLKMLNGHYNSTLNFGTPADNGVVYLTHGNVIGSGTWMQLRGKLGADGYLRGYAIYGGSGLIRYNFALKKVR